MRKQLYLITFLALFIVLLGTVSAADVADAGNVTKDTNVHSTSNVIKHTDTSTNAKTASSTVGKTTEKSVNVKVDYEYSDDIKRVTPDFHVFSNGTEINKFR